MSDSDVEEVWNKIIVLDEGESDDELIHIEEIRKDTLLSNLFIFCIFMSYDYIEESFYE